MNDDSLNRTNWWVRNDDPGYEAVLKGDYVTAGNWWWRNAEPDEPRNIHNRGVIAVTLERYEYAVELFETSAETMNYAPSQLALYHIFNNGAIGKDQKVLKTLR